jgi:hypothetical protein
VEANRIVGEKSKRARLISINPMIGRGCYPSSMTKIVSVVILIAVMFVFGHHWRVPTAGHATVSQLLALTSEDRP